MNLSIRPAHMGDVEVIAEFNRLMALETENKVLDPATLKAGVTAMLNDPNKGRYFVALAGRASDGGNSHQSSPANSADIFMEAIVGQLGVTFEWSDWRNGNFWWIQSVYVAKSARRHGVFRKLYEHVLEAARGENDVIGVRLYVEHENAAAQATYQKMGMVMTGYQVMEEEFNS